MSIAQAAVIHDTPDLTVGILRSGGQNLQYEDVGMSNLAEDVKKAVLLRHVPDVLEQDVIFHLDKYKMYDLIRQAANPQLLKSHRCATHGPRRLEGRRQEWRRERKQGSQGG